VDELDSGSGFGKGYDYPPSRAERVTTWLGARGKSVAQAILRAMLGSIGGIDAALHASRHRPPLSPATFHPERILVIRTDLIGDLVLTLPAIHALRRAYPDARIDLVALPSSAGIVRGHPDIDTIYTCEMGDWVRALISREARAKVGPTLHALRANHYDLAISVCGDWASIVAWLTGARRRVGFAGEAYAHLLTDPVPGRRYDLGRHEVEYGLLLAEHAAVGGIVDPIGSASRRPHLYPSVTDRAAITRILTEAGITPGQRLVALHAGARNGQAKRWPLPAWARLADRLQDADEDVAIILIGGPADKPLAQAVLRRMKQPARAIDLTGTTSLPELAALLAICAVVVTGDSGPLHIAEAVGTRIVALHGPTDPAQSGPCGPDAIVLRHPVHCMPCYDSRAMAECRYGNPLCMKGITPADVLAATRRQLHAIHEAEHPNPDA